MAEATGSYLNVSKIPTLRSLLVRGKLSLAGDYVTGGIFLGLNAGARSSVDKSIIMPTTKDPLPGSTKIEGVAGYIYEWKPSTDRLLIRQAAAAGNPLAEIPAAALPGGVTGDEISFQTEYPKFG